MFHVDFFIFCAFLPLQNIHFYSYSPSNRVKDDDQPPNGTHIKKEPKSFKEDSDFLNINQSFHRHKQRIGNLQYKDSWDIHLSTL